MDDILKYKLDLLKIEIDTINNAILDKDETSREIKKWATTVWAGAVGFVGAEHIGNPTVTHTIWAVCTAFIPMSFLILDAFHKRVQRKFIWRAKKIHSFINDIDWSLKESFAAGDINNFRIYDPGGENWRIELAGEESAKFERFISVSRIIGKPSLYVLYAGLTTFSIILAAIGWIPHMLELNLPQ